MINVKKVLISVYNKDKLDSVLYVLKNMDVEIFSTGGTAKFIKDYGFDVTLIEDYTGQPEMLDGRVKTLNPKIFGSLLYRRDDEKHISESKQFDLRDINLVIVNLYPFIENMNSKDKSVDEMVELIDIGGVTLLRASAKNYKHVCPVPNISYYEELITELKSNNGKISNDFSEKLAYNTFKLTMEYDTGISEYFSKITGDNNNSIFSLKIKKSTDISLRYGENPHQQAGFYNLKSPLLIKPENILNGKPLSYNNILDIDAGFFLLREFKNNKYTTVIIKHLNACGTAIADSPLTSFQKGWNSDPQSAFGSIIVTNYEIDKDVAQEINKYFIEIVIAPSYTEQGLAILKEKKNLRVLVYDPTLEYQNQNDVRTVIDGYLIQDKDNILLDENTLKNVTSVETDDCTMDDLMTAWKIVKHTKSNAIVLVKDKQLIGSGMGQTKRIDSVELAIKKAKQYNHKLEGSVLASDAFFPFRDSIDTIAEYGIKAVIQPGGSIRDKEVIEACNEHNIPMFFTGIRHFKH